MIKQLAGHPGAIWEVVESDPKTGLIIDLGAGGRAYPTATTVVDLLTAPRGFSGEFLQHDVCDW